MALLGDLRFSDFFVYVIHNIVNNLRSKQFGRQLIVVIYVSVEIEVRFEDMLCFTLKFFECTGQMIAVCFDPISDNKCDIHGKV
ncbi:conserved hypothetical protein [Vibrio crassostreae]|nr:hypothetical protein EDB37_10681 [Vibrio crassostreae]CAK2541105.1 conserved hypothetical protein [Vibrio crassostreae]CAK2553389.1 conserved hypothetical protein [Vibrio crassostreae]CAK2686018.1 conserved hypothetical protein [Vibrio crassostreae]CAK3153771.1 conserved hypothetical protein [Vibrio crassostreae]